MYKIAAWFECPGEIIEYQRNSIHDLMSTGYVIVIDDVIVYNHQPTIATSG